MPRSLLRHLSIALTHVRRVWLVAAVAIAVTLVSIVTVDVGPVIRSRAEAEASAFIDRPVHIGRLGVNIGRGGLVIEDLVVEGLTPAHDPWLVAGHIELSLTWNAIFGRELLVDTVEMTDWRLVVESYPNAIHNWPRLGGPPRPRGPGRVCSRRPSRTSVLRAATSSCATSARRGGWMRPTSRSPP